MTAEQEIVYHPGFADARPSTLFELRHASTARVITVVVPERRLFAIEGHGHPRAAGFEVASRILRTIEQNVARRLQHGPSYRRPKAALEIMWSLPAGGAPDLVAAALADPERRHWTQMVAVPVAATDADAITAIDTARAQAGRAAPLVRIVRFREGFSAQLLGTDEVSPILSLYHFAADAGLTPNGPVHQIVLSDLDLVPPQRARSIFRLPLASG